MMTMPESDDLANEGLDKKSLTESSTWVRWIPEHVKSYIEEEIAKAIDKERERLMTVIDDAVAAVQAAAANVDTAAQAIIADLNGSDDAANAALLQTVATSLQGTADSINTALGTPPSGTTDGTTDGSAGEPQPGDTVPNAVQVTEPTGPPA
jgi:hypothetical protein